MDLRDKNSGKFNEMVKLENKSKTHCSQFVKTSKKLVKKFDQLLSAAGWRELRKADDVCKQNTTIATREEADI